MNNAQWLYAQVPGPDDEDEGVHLSSAHALQIAGELTRGSEALGKLQACEKELKDKHEAYEIAVMQAMENGARANGYADRLEVVSKEVEAMEALLEKATNDVSAWRTRATSAESRLDAIEKAARVLVFAAERDRWPDRHHGYFKELAALVETQRKNSDGPDNR